METRAFEALARLATTQETQRKQARERDTAAFEVGLFALVLFAAFFGGHLRMVGVDLMASDKRDTVTR
jgi:hypothetical protein